MKLWPHQIQTRDFALGAGRLYDMSDPGTGKTAAHIATFNSAHDAARCLVVCPKTLMRSAWGADIAKFFPHFGVVYADPQNRLGALTSKAEVVIVNVDGVKDLASEERYIKKHFSHLIIDEVTAYKHHTSQRSKAIKKIARAIKHVHGLSGTPNPNSVTELWHPMLLIDGGKRLGTSFTNFRNAVQTPEQTGPSRNHIRWVDRPMAEEATFKLIEDVSIRHAFEEVMQHVPPNHKQVIEFDPSKKMLAHYRKLEDECVLALGSGVSAVHASALRQKLLQICSGAVYYDNGKYEVIDNTRYALILELIEERAQSVVAFNWTHQRDQLVLGLKKMGISHGVLDGSTPAKMRDELVAQFQAGDLRTLLMHPETGAHGLTLTAADTSIIASPFYRADWFKQFIHRIYRGVQDKVTNTLLIRAGGTVEEYVYDAMLDKTERMADFLGMVQRAKERR